MQTVIIDQEFKNLIPPLTAEERAGLEAMIVADGCREPLIIWGGVIVDGHNRFEICTRLDIPYETREMFFADRDAVVEWIIKNQFGRRNLALYDRTKLALRLEEVYAARAKANLSAPTGGKVRTTLQNSAKSIDVREEVSKAAGVSHDTVSKVKTIEAKATDADKAALSAGETTINKVYTGIKKKEGNSSVRCEPKPGRGQCSNALQFATIAISQLTRIREEDPQRVAALLEVKEYIDSQLQKGA